MGRDHQRGVPANHERTPDGRYVVIDGRRWRATDTGIPAELRAQLVRELMSARRAVRTARGGTGEDLRRARSRVHDAKVALGERGEPWWEAGTPDGRRARIVATTRSLLRSRDPEATLCPSEIARVVAGGGDWRRAGPEVREVLEDSVGEGEIVLTQGGVTQDPALVTGPVRVARGRDFPAG